MLTGFVVLGEKMLSNYLNEDRIQLKVDVKTWRDAVTKVGNLMVEKDDISQSYINAMIKGIEELGPYCVVAPGIALLHARPEDGVKRIGLVMATFREGVAFGTKNDPVYLAFGLGAVDHKSHIDLLQDLSILLQDTEIVQRLMEFDEGEKAAALALITNYQPSDH